MVGAIASGQIAEYICRKGSLMIAAIPNIIGWLCISFATDTSFLYMGRLLEGFGVGIISYTMSVTIEIMLAYLLGLFANWRILAILGNCQQKHIHLNEILLLYELLCDLSQCKIVKVHV
ncbi:putative major facilitator, sugar transporter, MFS transporter superfamily [Helianthus debilis subsp. tardiflorus]